MLTRKKSGIGIKPDLSLSSVNTTRTYNVRRKVNWPEKTLFNLFSNDMKADFDECDKKQQSFFNCDVPVSNNSVLFGHNDALPRSTFKEKKIIEKTAFKLDSHLFSLFLKSKPLDAIVKKEDVIVKKENPICPAVDTSTVDVIELSDDEEDSEVLVVGEVRKTGPPTVPGKLVQSRRYKKNAKTLADFIKDVQIVEVNTMQIEDEKWHGAALDSCLVDNLKEDYLAVGAQKNRKKPKVVVLRPNEKRKSKSVVTSARLRSPSPIRIDFSSDDEVPVIKKTIENKKEPSAAVSKRTKFKKRIDEEPPRVALQAGEFIIPKKDPKLRIINMDDFLRSSEAKQQKEKVARIVKQKKEKEEELLKNKNTEPPPVFKIPKKNVPSAPSENSLDQSEPIRKKMRVEPSGCEPAIDILGAITDAMNAVESTSRTSDPTFASPIKRKEEWVLPRIPDEPIMPPSIPTRFRLPEDMDDMDISNDSLEESHIALSERNAASSTLIDEGINKMGRTRLDDGVSSIIGKSSEDTFENSERTINKGSMTPGPSLADEYLLQGHACGVKYRLVEVDNVKNIPPVNSSPLASLLMVPKECTDGSSRESGTTDPRIPAFSPNTQLSWKSMRVELNLKDSNINLLNKKTEDEDENTTKKMKKGVKWGENATKEFNPNDVRLIETDGEKGFAEECVGEREFGGKTYRIVKKVPVVPSIQVTPKPKSCLKTSLDPQYPPTTGSEPPAAPSLADDEDSAIFRIPAPPIPPPMGINIPSLASLARTITPKLNDFVPPPGFESDEQKKEREMKERREKEEKERKDREEKERKLREEKEKQEKDKKDREEKERKEKEDHEKTMGFDPSKLKESEEMNGQARIKMGASSSFSMGNLNTGPSSGAGIGASASLNNMKTRIFEKGSQIIGDRSSVPVYPLNEVKEQLDWRIKIIDILKVHRIIKEDPEMEYPANSRYPTYLEQLKEQNTYSKELTETEKNWLRDGVQPLWTQPLPLEPRFSFQFDAGLYWPIVQATDRIKEDSNNFESFDVLRSLGDNTHFATEKKSLLGIECFLPNGMTHSERFDAFFSGIKPEGRFKNRRMYSRVFSSQSVDEARAKHSEEMEKERSLLKQHEETMRKNAPEGITIERLRTMPTERPTGFRDFPNMIQYYKNDIYDLKKPFQSEDWYCNRTDYYMPYTERVNYLCSVINHYNMEFNARYQVNMPDEDEWLVDNDKAAFATAQIVLGQMEGWNRVGMTEDTYYKLLRRKRERIALLNSASFSLKKYMELSVMSSLEKPYFHHIIDWLSSIFKTIRPISEWPFDRVIDSAFHEIIMISDKRDADGFQRDAREVFYEAYQSANQKPSSPKRPRYDSDDDY